MVMLPWVARYMSCAAGDEGQQTQEHAAHIIQFHETHYQDLDDGCLQERQGTDREKDVGSFQCG